MRNSYDHGRCGRAIKRSRVGSCLCNGEVACNLIAEIATTLILAYSISARPPVFTWEHERYAQEERENDREERREKDIKGSRRRRKIAGAVSGSEHTERPSICIANWRSIYGHRRTVNRASLELKLITFMSGAMYHYARGPRAPVDAAAVAARGDLTAGANMRNKAR